MNTEGQNMPLWFESVIQKKIKVLFWDDNAETKQKNLFLEIKKGFEKLGWDAVITADKNKALKKALTGEFDVVVLDLLENHKPVGLEILKEIRSCFPHLPIIIFSVASELRFVQGAMRGDVSYYLTKPITGYHDIVRAVEVAMERELAKRRMLHERYFASLGSLAASVGHYIKNSLWTISSRAQYLMEKTDEKDETFELLHTIDQRCAEANQIIVNLLNYAKRKSRRKDFSEVNILESLTGVVNLLSYEFKNQHIEVENKIKPEKVIIRGNEFYLKEAFLNLVKNSIEAMPDGGKLSLDAYHKDGRIHIQISDTGQGMSKDTQERLFIPFYSTKNNSMGYGLFETQRIINEHQGAISIESELKKGTRVYVQLPAVRIEEVETNKVV
ncbi:MAG: hybrid sensor histidine kinase/response regulator [Calditrichaeota bacterium]|nr:hybrid sensor histidine kinase/response regulator [Calditrichota bacterium]